MMISYRYWKYRNLILISIVCIAFMVVGASALILMGATEAEPVPLQPGPSSNVTIIIPAPAINETLLAIQTEQDYQDFKYRNRLHNLTEWYSWRRDDVSGLKDMLVKTTIYGYRFEPNFQEHSVSWGTGSWFYHLPDTGMKYLFIYACMFMPGNSTRWDPRMWGMEADHFTVEVDGILYHPLLLEVDPREPILELENTWDVDHIHTIKPYGYDDLSYNRNGEQIRATSDYLRMGRSNKWDGWILYEVPANTRPEDVYVLGYFDNLGGDAFWSLLP
jgi:hypothetical protein